MISGWQKNTLIDYPGNIASTIFIGNCNFNCKFCHNPELINNPQEEFKLEEILKYLSKAKKILDGVSITGGEPTLDKDIAIIINKIKELGLKVKIDTNGSRPEILKTLKVDYIAMDLKSSLSRYNEFTKLTDIQQKIEKSINYIITSGIDYEFRTTLAPTYTSPEDIHNIGKTIKGAEKWFLQKYKNQKTLDLKYGEIAPYSNQENQKLLDIAKTYIPNAKLRG